MDIWKHSLGGRYIRHNTPSKNRQGVDCSHLYSQEPDPEPVIKQFADGYGVNFDMFAKINVNGAYALPLYKYLKSQLKGTLGR